MQNLVSVEWLRENIEHPDLILLDASSIFGITIPSALFFDLKGVFRDSVSPLPNTVPSPEEFQKEVRFLGISTRSKIVVFDNKGVYFSPRVWWLFKIMDHEDIAVLDGGLPEWVKKGYSTEIQDNRKCTVGDFESKLESNYIKTYENIVDNVNSNEFTIIDARSEGRFNGIEKEPRPELKSGSIPNSVNIPYSSVLENGKFKSKTELKHLFESKSIDNKELVFSCGSGITACIVMLASEIGYKECLNLFDGSWTEWAERQNLKE